MALARRRLKKLLPPVATMSRDHTSSFGNWPLARAQHTERMSSNSSSVSRPDKGVFGLAYAYKLIQFDLDGGRISVLGILD
jgi:hypothetical protein